jgi:hypothetical protein
MVTSETTYSLSLENQTPTDIIIIMCCLRKGECFRMYGQLYEVMKPSWESSSGSVLTCKPDDELILQINTLKPVIRVPREIYEAEQVLCAMMR